MKMVLAIWEDASAADSETWVDRGTARTPEAIIFHQVGFLFSISPTEIVLTECVGEHVMGARTRIPAGMVKSLVELAAGLPMSIPKHRRKTK